MADFKCGCQGNRGEATRLGSKNSGAYSFVNSWQTKAFIEIRKNSEGKDLIGISIRRIGSENLKHLDIDFPDFEDLTDITINGISLIGEDIKILREALQEDKNILKKLRMATKLKPISN